MPIHRLHIDFIRFLDEIEKGGSPWEAYKHNYLLPNSVFLETYWEKLDITLSQIKERVERVKKTDYSNLLTLLQDSDLGTLVETTIHRCGEFLKAPYPDVYLFVGFFSSDGFVIRLLGKPVIGIGLERFRDFRNLKLILTHEYCHYYLKLKSRLSPLMQGEHIFSEGVASLFSEAVYPDVPLYQHLFFTRSRLNSCIQTEHQAFHLIKEKPIPKIYSLLRKGNERSGIPPRAGNYISYRLVQKFMKDCGNKDVRDLLNTKGISKKWNIFLKRRLKLKASPPNVYPPSSSLA